MCLAVPGKIIKIEKDMVTLDFEIEKRTARIVDDGYNIGDYVIAQGGIIVMKVPKEQALLSLEAYKNSQM